MAKIRSYEKAWFGRIEDLENIEDLALIDTEQDLEALYEYLGKPRWFKNFGGCFVKVDEGEYKEIYCYKGKVPYLDKDVYKIIRVGRPDIGDRVRLRPDVLSRHAKRVPPRARYTREQLRWRRILQEHKNDVGVVETVFPNSKHVNVRFPDGTLIGIDYDELELLD